MRVMTVIVHDVRSIAVETGIAWIVSVLDARYGLKDTGRDWVDGGEVISADSDGGVVSVIDVCIEFFVQYYNNRGVACTCVSRALFVLAEPDSYH